MHIVIISLLPQSIFVMSAAIILKSVIECPECRFSCEEVMPVDDCQFFYIYLFRITIKNIRRPQVCYQKFLYTSLLWPCDLLYDLSQNKRPLF